MILWTWFENKNVGYFRETLNIAVYFHYSTISKVQVCGDLLKARFTSYMLLKLQAKCIVRRCLKNGRTLLTKEMFFREEGRFNCKEKIVGKRWQKMGGGGGATSNGKSPISIFVRLFLNNGNVLKLNTIFIFSVWYHFDTIHYEMPESRSRANS